jgi:tetratricopeptide (TPR) repeat protein
VLGRYQEAIAPLKKSTELKSTVFAHFDLGKVYSVLGRHAEALSEFQQVLELEPRELRSVLQIGLEYLSLGNKQGAIQQYQILKEHDPELAQQLYNAIYQ